MPSVSPRKIRKSKVHTKHNSITVSGAYYYVPPYEYLNLLIDTDFCVIVWKIKPKMPGLPALHQNWMRKAKTPGVQLLHPGDYNIPTISCMVTV